MRVGSPLRRVVLASKPYAGALLLSFLSGGFFAASRYVRAYLAKPLIDEVLVPSANLDAPGVLELFQPQLIEIGMIATLTVVVTPIAFFGRNYLVGAVVAQVRRDLDQKVAHVFLHASLQHRGEGSMGDQLTRALSDVRFAANALSLLYRDLATNILMISGGIIALCWTSWPLAILTLTMAPIFWALLRFFGSRIETQSMRRQQTQGVLAHRLVGILSGIKVIKAFRGQSIEKAAFARQTDRYFKRSMNVLWNRVMAKASTEALAQTGGLLVLAVGSWLALNRLWGITLGTLAAFAIILLATYKPIKALTTAYSGIMEHLVGAHRLFELLDLDEEAPDRPNAIPFLEFAESIRFRNVHFDYGEKPVLNHVDFEVRPGEVVAIVGKTGSGKSTILDLLLRFYDPTSGSIEIDGVDLQDIQRNSFLDRVAVVAQEPFLFDISILENIRYGSPHASFGEVENAAKAAEAHDFILQLPNGYETPMDEFGRKLSGGQRQRITIARAILRDASILVFDEATSALDTQTERTVQATIESLRGTHTIFIVSHRLSTIRSADRIVVLDAGEVVEVGDHESMCDRPGLYRDLMQSQFAAGAV